MITPDWNVARLRRMSDARLDLELSLSCSKSEKATVRNIISEREDDNYVNPVEVYRLAISAMDGIDDHQKDSNWRRRRSNLVDLKWAEEAWAEEA